MVSSNSYIINAYKLKPMPEKIFKHWFSKFLVKLPNILNNNETAVWSFRSKDISSSWWCQTRPRKIFRGLVLHYHSLKISFGLREHTVMPHFRSFKWWYKCSKSIFITFNEQDAIFQNVKLQEETFEVKWDVNEKSFRRVAAKWRKICNSFSHKW